MVTTRADDLETLLARARDRRRLPEPAVRRLLREGAHLTQADVAHVLGVSRVACTRWESGTRTPRGELAERYRALLDRLAQEAARV
jgi:DNA-binding XRE family transcriptional regulator